MSIVPELKTRKIKYDVNGLNTPKEGDFMVHTDDANIVKNVYLIIAVIKNKSNTFLNRYNLEIIKCPELKQVSRIGYNSAYVTVNGKEISSWGIRFYNKNFKPKPSI